MDESALLLVGIEVSVALAGFAGIVATFQHMGDKGVSRGDAVGLTIIVNFSFMGAFFCALPLVLSVFGADTATVWAINSALQCAYVVNRMRYIHVNMSVVPLRKRTRWLFRAIQGTSALLAVALALNAGNQLVHREPGPSIAALLFGLGIVAFMFGRLLLRPLWKAVHVQEAGA